MSKKLLLVDTNVVSHALTPTQTDKYKGLFSELEKKYRFVVTGFTLYELTCSSDKENRVKIETYIKSEMAFAELTKPLMSFSARIAYLYSKHSSTQNKTFKVGDIINAAFCIAKDCHLMTIDNTDHPKPFFMDVERYPVTYTSRKNKPHTDYPCILRPHMDNVRQCFKEHEV
ncbi:MAG TPA: type II toxin-antitoxin system VapC family toxin [Candidatus Sulfotelmatobacter sp.]|nr:type II toxin-antitoxin system VapC family toxin [Candidatus Sulfotelmatobacter sp.]